jgi:hypothetical protein
MPSLCDKEKDSANSRLFKGITILGVAFFPHLVGKITILSREKDLSQRSVHSERG